MEIENIIRNENRNRNHIVYHRVHSGNPYGLLEYSI